LVQEQVGDRLLLVGTAHVSPESVREVEEAVAKFQPDVVAVELDANRLAALEDKQKWESTPIHKLLKSDKLWLFLTQVLLASYQRKMGEMYGAEPGAEMLAGVRAGRAQGKEILLADRDVSITMRRAVGSMRFREKMRLGWELFKAMFTPAEEEAPKKIEELTQEDAVTGMMKELGEIAPTIKTVVIDERDTYLATRLQQPLSEGKRVVGIVGAGHMPGIRARLQAGGPPADLAPLESLPAKRFSLAKFVFGWGFLALLFGLFGYFIYEGIRSGNWDDLVHLIRDLFIYGGGLAALGCLLARGHPLSIVTAFVVAPFTILHPGLAAGWFSGIVEAWIREPRVLDFQNLGRLTTFGSFFNNRVIRVLFVAAFTNIGAMVGAAIVLKRGFGSILAGARTLTEGVAGLGEQVAAGDLKALALLAGAALVAGYLVLRRRNTKS
jgi:pheromone shutdown-related protein TraB